MEEIYGRLANDETPDAWALRFQLARGAGDGDVAATPVNAVGRRSGPGPVRQWATLTSRTFDATIHNRLTLAILVGSPVMVVAMFAVLFRSGAFRFEDPSPTAIVMILFWVTFGAFFFGLTYGLLQVCTERPILRREHLVGLRLDSYLLSKVAVLLPFLILVNVVMIAVLRVLDRLPAAGLGTYLSLGFTLALLSAAALMLGLLTSSAVASPSQATLALPMLCFPAVLFSGAIVPVNLMAGVGVAISALTPNRWAFEAVGHDLDVRRLLAEGGSPLGPPLLASYGNAGTDATGYYWATLVGFIVVFFVASLYVLRITCRRALR